MDSLDDLAFEAEVEAEVLRAVSGMTPARAQEFLIGIVLKIKRAGVPQRGITLPRVLASVAKSVSPLAVSLASLDRPSGLLRVEEMRGRIAELRGHVKEIVEFVRVRGQATGTEVADHFKAVGTAKRSNVFSALGYLNRKGILRRTDGLWSLAVLQEDFEER